MCNDVFSDGTEKGVYTGVANDIHPGAYCSFKFLRLGAAGLHLRGSAEGFLLPAANSALAGTVQKATACSLHMLRGQLCYS